MPPIARLSSHVPYEAPQEQEAPPTQSTSQTETSAEQVHQETGPFQFFQDSPVVELAGPRISQVGQSFSDSVEQYTKDQQGRPVSESLPENADSDDVDLAEGWEERSRNTLMMARGIKMNPEPYPNTTQKTFSYDMGDGQSAGMMTLTHSPLETGVRLLATHPGSSGVGKTMIEKAVNESQAAGNHGVVRLSSLDDTSEGFYASTGFQSEEDDNMKLDPSNSDLWTQQSGVWSLKENQNKGYLKKTEDN